MTYLSPFRLRQAIEQINAGRLIAYPTEAVYGLGCNPLDEEAVLNLLALKKRSIDKGMILIASSLAQLEPYLQLNDTILNRVQPAWPGAITWIIPAQPWVPKWLTGKHPSLAVRVTDHPIAQLLCKENQGPLVSTSANISDDPAVKRSWMIHKKLNNKELFILPGQIGRLAQATPIYNALTGQQIR